MSNREKLATTLGILIAGLLEAEDAAAESERRPGRPAHKASGVYPTGDAFYATDMPPESSPTGAASEEPSADDYRPFADLTDPL